MDDMDTFFFEFILKFSIKFREKKEKNLIQTQVPKPEVWYWFIKDGLVVLNDPTGVVDVAGMGFPGAYKGWSRPDPHQLSLIPPPHSNMKLSSTLLGEYQQRM